MKALLLSEYRRLEMTDVADPKPQPDEILVRVRACGICGSDVHGYDGSSGRRIPPLIMGHEAAGVVAAVGAEVKNFSIGDRVTFDSTIYCGACRDCQRGAFNLCSRRQVLGVSCDDYRRAGAFAEFVAVPARIAYRLPDNLSFEEASLLEAVSVALHAVSLTPIEPDSGALVVGAGTIGLLLLQAVRNAGCARVFVTDTDPTRLKLAESLGATATFVPGSDLGEHLSRETNGAGIELALEAVGIDATVSAAISAVRKGGTVVLVGNVSPEVNLPLQAVVTRQIRLQGSCASAGEYPEAIRLVSSGAIRVQPLISAVAKLDDGPRWFERLYAREPNLMKVILTP
jgi:L-iditol 2-dehydrogenase